MKSARMLSLEVLDSSNLKTQQFSFDTELVQLMKKQILAEYNPANDPFAPKNKIKFIVQKTVK